MTNAVFSVAAAAFPPRRARSMSQPRDASGRFVSQSTGAPLTNVPPDTSAADTTTSGPQRGRSSARTSGPGHSYPDPDDLRDDRDPERDWKPPPHRVHLTNPYAPSPGHSTGFSTALFSFPPAPSTAPLVTQPLYPPGPALYTPATAFQSPAPAPSPMFTQPSPSLSATPHPTANIADINNTLSPRSRELQERILELQLQREQIEMDAARERTRCEEVRRQREQLEMEAARERTRREFAAPSPSPQSPQSPLHPSMLQSRTTTASVPIDPSGAGYGHAVYMDPVTPPEASSTDAKHLHNFERLERNYRQLLLSRSLGYRRLREMLSERFLAGAAVFASLFNITLCPDHLTLHTGANSLKGTADYPDDCSDHFLWDAQMRIAIRRAASTRTETATRDVKIDHHDALVTKSVRFNLSLKHWPLICADFNMSWLHFLDEHGLSDFWNVNDKGRKHLIRLLTKLVQPVDIRTIMEARMDRTTVTSVAAWFDILASLEREFTGCQLAFHRSRTASSTGTTSSAPAKGG